MEEKINTIDDLQFTFAMNSNSPKLLVAIVCIFILFGIGTWIDRVYFCGPKASRVSEQLGYLRDSLVLQKIELLKSDPGHEINLVRDTMSITSTKELREIQKIILKSKRRATNHPVSTWSVQLKITFANNEDLSVAVNKISNDSIDSMTYFSFPNSSCPGDEVYYSLELGTYLEKLVLFQGKKHK